jgi:hypothetical protein
VIQARKFRREPSRGRGVSFSAPGDGLEVSLPPFVDELLARSSSRFDDLLEKVSQAILKQNNQWPPRDTGMAYQGANAYLHPSDNSTILEVFWDLFRQGVITLGKDMNNPGWPWFRLSRFGENIKSQSQFRFHDTSSYIAMIKSYDPDISPSGVLYLEEAAASFYADCLLSASVMLGVAAETEFLRALDVATSSAQWGSVFVPVTKAPFIRGKIQKFQTALASHRKSVPHDLTEDLDTNLSMIQSVLRLARNDAGHPTGSPAPTREQVYVNLQLFGPFCRQLARLRKALK